MMMAARRSISQRVNQHEGKHSISSCYAPLYIGGGGGHAVYFVCPSVRPSNCFVPEQKNEKLQEVYKFLWQM